MNWSSSREDKGLRFEWMLWDSRAECFLPSQVVFPRFFLYNVSLDNPFLSAHWRVRNVCSHAFPTFIFFYWRTHHFSFVLECAGVLTKSVWTGTTGFKLNRGVSCEGEGLHPKRLKNDMLVFLIIGLLEFSWIESESREAQSKCKWMFTWVFGGTLVSEYWCGGA